MQKFADLRRHRQQRIEEEEEESSSEEAEQSFSYQHLLETHGVERMKDITGFTDE